jgi:2-polyprenyl-3-methyl-5-hydroxy-6-metoxy-1,4-benzoquinol methylase
MVLFRTLARRLAYALEALAKSLRTLGEQPRTRVPSATEFPPEWYDAVYRTTPRYHTEYTGSHWYPVWTVIASKIPRTARVLEIGCGPGQFARLLLDRRVQSYRGFDFSTEAIAMAKRQSPEGDFSVADALTTPLLDDRTYDTVVCTEVLEHVRDDLRILSRIPAGVRCLITVPSYNSTSHVRFFETSEAVSSRYASLFDDVSVDEVCLTRPPAGERLYLLDGVRGR